MKIDFLIGNMTGGGAQRVISVLANHLAQKGHIIKIISFRGGDEYPLDPSIKREHFNKKVLVNSVVFNGYFQLFNFYRKKSNRPDVMSSHINSLGFLTIPIAKIFRIKIIVSEHINHQVDMRFRKRFLWKRLYPLVDAVTILTHFDYDFFSKKNKKVVVMPNPSSFENREISENHIRKKEIIAIGSLDRYHHKGFDNLLDIAHEVGKENTEWIFKIVGAGEQGRRFLEQKTNDLHLTNVEFMGFRTDIKEILYNAEIYVLPSRFEGLPMTLLEAYSQGAACIAYDCISGPSDIITNRQDGLLIENQNSKAMITGLLELLENTELRKELQKNAPFALEKFSIENVGDKWEVLLNDVVNGS